MPADRQALLRAIAEAISIERHGDLPQWLQALDSAPQICASSTDFASAVRFGRREDATPAQYVALCAALEALIPWRKGPYDLFGCEIDAEWRSDFKWDRLAPWLDAADKRILDVGCGNGYHMWRSLAQRPSAVVGIDPSPRFWIQFYLLKKYYQGVIPIDVLPLTSEQMPSAAKFDRVLSMGVFYHRRSPLDHLLELKSFLQGDGRLILETLVVEGPDQQVLVPADRYAQMRNVWFLPSVPTLINWMRRCGFTSIQCVHVGETSTDEQRSTTWMRFQSLPDFLHPENSSRTIEGYPRPRRAMFVAEVG